MYSEETLSIPADENELWDVLWEQFEFVRHVLWELDVETREEALANDYHTSDDGSVARSGMGVIRHRDIGNELDQRDHYLAMGRNLLPYIHQCLDERQLTPEFVQQWGKIMFCHGYIASYVFDDSDDMESARMRAKGTRAMDRTPQRVFLARLLLWFMDEHKQPRKQAELTAAKTLREFINASDSKKMPLRYDLAWFKTLVRDRDDARIVSSMEQNNMSEAALRDLAASESIDLPPISLVLPAVRT